MSENKELMKKYKDTIWAAKSLFKRGKTIMDAFYGIEELEESAHIAWELRNEEPSTYNKIQ